MFLYLQAWAAFSLALLSPSFDYPMNPAWVLLYTFIATELIFITYLHYALGKGRKRKWLYGFEILFIAALGYAFGTLKTGDDSGLVRHIKNAIFIIGLGKTVVSIFFLGIVLRNGCVYIMNSINNMMMKRRREHPQQGKGAKVLVQGALMNRARFIEILGVGAGVAFSGTLFAGWRNKYAYRVHSHRLLFQDLPHAFRGLRIAQLSDIHAGSFTDKEAVRRGVRTVMAQGADLIFFTGDLVNNRHEEMYDYMDVFSELQAPMGVYSILGNHDYGDYVRWKNEAAREANLRALKKQHEDLGWKLLLNEHIPLRKDGEQITLIGVENWSAARRFSRYGDLGKAMQGVERDTFKILLSHDPTHWDTQVVGKTPIQLTFSGHTHGMQLGVEVPFFKWSPAKFLFPHWAGLYKVGTQYLYVNRGFGFIGYQGRVGIMPEITVIDLL